jgi:ribosomal protein S12 methylthiotransferase
VIIDREEGEYFIGRTQYDSPEVDCEVLIPIHNSQFTMHNSQGTIHNGEFVDVKITKAEEFDLYGEIIVNCEL